MPNANLTIITCAAVAATMQSENAESVMFGLSMKLQMVGRLEHCLMKY
jgi:hypothetical protein